MKVICKGGYSPGVFAFYVCTYLARIRALHKRVPYYDTKSKWTLILWYSYCHTIQIQWVCGEQFNKCDKYTFDPDYIYTYVEARPCQYPKTDYQKMIVIFNTFV